jgi:hypothetical protein
MAGTGHIAIINKSGSRTIIKSREKEKDATVGLNARE